MYFSCFDLSCLSCKIVTTFSNFNKNSYLQKSCMNILRTLPNVNMFFHLLYWFLMFTPNSLLCIPITRLFSYRVKGVNMDEVYNIYNRETH
jgi:hypothetical protein